MLARERTERDMLQKRCYGLRPSARREENMSARQIASRTLQTQFQARSSTQRRWSLLCFPASCAVTSLAKYTPIGTHAHTHTHPALGSTNDKHSWVSPGVDGVQGCTCTQNTYTHTHVNTHITGKESEEAAEDSNTESISLRRGMRGLLRARLGGKSKWLE